MNIEMFTDVLSNGLYYNIFLFQNARGGARSLSEVRRISLHWYAFIVESNWQFVVCFCAKLVKYHENWFKIVQT